ncbi:MAG: HD domain-containing protein [Candidatus Nanohaloarchaea archaeon]
MRFDDPLYGEKKVEEDVLQELVGSRPVQRLKKIHQAGPQPFFIEKESMTRFPHSLGVMFLLREFDAPLEEQIAGLLHDVPHTAFSHVADFVFDNSDHEYHDQFLEEVVMDSEIPAILERHGLDVDYILDEDNFPLLERDAPDLCADRIDYFLRDVKMMSGEDVSHLHDALVTRGNRFVLEDRERAEEYALRYIQADEEWWANPREVAVMEIFSRAMNRALEIGLIEEQDFFGTDRELLQVLRESDDEEIREKLELLDSGFEIVRDREDYDFRVETKARYVDPQVAAEDMRRISELSEKVEERIEEHRQDVENGYCIRIKD